MLLVSNLGTHRDPSPLERGVCTAQNAPKHQWDIDNKSKGKAFLNPKGKFKAKQNFF